MPVLTSAPGAADLGTCDREPIHLPGSIQPHGMLLVLDEPGLQVSHASRNALGWIGSGGEGGLDAAAPGLAALIRGALERGGVGARPRPVGRFDLGAGDAVASYATTLHRSGPSLILELEPAGEGEGAPVDGPAQPFDIFSPDILSQLDEAGSVADLCQTAAAEIRRLIGFDRVLVYRFDEDWNGTVVAEDRNDALPTYLGLRFPASDIPAQARELYRSNRTRLIANAGYVPVPVVARAESGDWGDEPDRSIDLRFASLRSVSPVHVEYMINMGTWASFSISILRDGVLWGLFACHHRCAKLVPQRVREACDFLGQVLSIQLAAKSRRVEYEERIGGKSAQSRLVVAMSDSDDFVGGLVDHANDLLEVVGSTGAAICHEGETTLIGATPARDQVVRIIDWLEAQGREEIQVRDSLAGLVPHADEFRAQASGLLAISISKLHAGYILWFRPEVVRTVAWGGDPSKAVVAEDDGRIHPRRSFEAWLETVRSHAEPWRPADVEAAAELRNTIVGIILRRAEERAQLSTELERSNKELEAFSYSVSHDLRAPFRHIVGYSDLLREEEGPRLSSEGLRYINTIIDAAQNAGTLVDNLLAFSRMGRTTIHPVPIDLNALVREVVREAMLEAGQRSITWKIDPMPEVYGDLMMLRLALANLASNAVKYTRKVDDPVIAIEAESDPEEVVIRVRDNGIGFDMRYVDKLFGVFQRLHHQEDFEGTGIGLANVRRIIGRHGGRTWAEGAPGRGATFSFSLPKTAARIRFESGRRGEP